MMQRNNKVDSDLHLLIYSIKLLLNCITETEISWIRLDNVPTFVLCYLYCFYLNDFITCCPSKDGTAGVSSTQQKDK